MATPPVLETRPGVVGVFATLDGALLALRELKSKGYDNLTVYSPVPNHELEDVMGHGTSPVRLFTLIGGLTGCFLGFLYAIWTSLDWELITGGKPIVSLPPYVIIVTSLSHEYEPWQWTDAYRPNWVELGIVAGSFCWFTMWFLLFIKFFPSVAIAEVKESLPPPGRQGGHH